ncbi:tetratricopeptide repeat protein [Natrialbaceae archaeon A-CW2]
MRERDTVAATEELLRRLDLLERLCRSPAYIRDLVDETESSRATIHRALNDLEDLDLVRRGDQGIEVTIAGQLAYDRLDTFLSTFEDILTTSAVLEPLSGKTAIEPAIVADCEPILATKPAPYQPFERLYDDLARATRYRAMMPTLEDPRHVRVLYERVVTHGHPATLLVTPEVYTTLRRNFSRQMTAMAAEEHFSVLVGSLPKYGIGLLESASVDRRTGQSAPIYVSVFDDRGALHGLLINDTPAAIEWAERQYSTASASATERTAALAPDTDGGSVVIEDTATEIDAEQPLPTSLEREGFRRIDASYFHNEPVADPSTAWRAGLSMAEIHTGYAIDRVAAGDDGDAPSSEPQSLASLISSTLAGGTHCVVLGPPGSGKSTVCKQVACAWYENDWGPVLYRSRDGGRPLTAVEDLVTIATATDEHTLCVIEDAVRLEANAVFEVIDRLDDRTDVSFLLDARESEWRTFLEPSTVSATAEASHDVVDSAPFEVVSVPPLGTADCRRLVDHLEDTVGTTVDLPIDQLWSSIVDESAVSEGDTNQMLRLVHRLATYADPLSTEMTALEDATAAVYDEVADNNTALSVSLLTNILNVAGVGVDRGLLLSVATVDTGDGAETKSDTNVGDDNATFEAVTDAIEDLEGTVIFPRGDGTYRTVHEAWSTAFLAHFIDAVGTETSARQFAAAVNPLLALAEDHERRAHLEARVESGWQNRTVIEEPERWAADLVEALYDVARTRPKLAVLFGDGTEEVLALPASCPAKIRGEIPRILGGTFVRSGHFDRAESAFDRLGGEGSGDIERLLGLTQVALERGEYENAADLSRRCIDQTSTSEEAEAHGRAHLRHAQALAYLHERDDALAAYRETLETFEAADLHHWAVRTHAAIATFRVEGAEFDRAREQCEVGLEIAATLDDYHQEAELLDVLGKVYVKQGEFGRASGLFERALERRQAAGDRRGIAHSYQNLGIHASRQGDARRAVALFERALEYRRELGNNAETVKTLSCLGLATTECGELEAAIELFEECLEMARAAADTRQEAIVLLNMAIPLARLGAHEEAKDAYERSLQRFEEIGDEFGQAKTLFNLALITLRRDQYDRATTLCRRSLALFGPLGDRAGEAAALCNLGAVARIRGDLNRARVLVESSLEISRSGDDHRGMLRAAVHLGRTERCSGALDDARDHFERGRNLGMKMDASENLIHCHLGLAAVALDADRPADAAEHLERAREVTVDDGAPVTWQIQLSRARLALARGELDEAGTRAREALEAFESFDERRSQARCVRLLARVAVANGEDDRAKDSFFEALETFVELGIVFEALRTLEALENWEAATDVDRSRAHDLCSDLPPDVLAQHAPAIDHRSSS